MTDISASLESLALDTKRDIDTRYIMMLVDQYASTQSASFRTQVADEIDRFVTEAKASRLPLRQAALKRKTWMFWRMS